VGFLGPPRLFTSPPHGCPDSLLGPLPFKFPPCSPLTRPSMRMLLPTWASAYQGELIGAWRLAGMRERSIYGHRMRARPCIRCRGCLPAMAARRMQHNAARSPACSACASCTAAHAREGRSRQVDPQVVVPKVPVSVAPLPLPFGPLLVPPPPHTRAHHPTCPSLPWPAIPLCVFPARRLFPSVLLSVCFFLLPRFKWKQETCCIKKGRLHAIGTETSQWRWGGVPATTTA
jgi:hypothetical protein